MKLDEFHRQWQAKIPREIKKVYATFPEELLEPLHYCLDHPGKWIRPYFLYLMNPDLSEEEFLSYFVLLELLHGATLAHDDILDGDKLRRQGKSLWHRFGVRQALQTGDLQFLGVYRVLEQLPLSAEEKIQRMEWVNHGVSQLIGGQMLEDQLLHRSPWSMEQYYQTCDGKTGSLFHLIFRLAGKNDERSREAAFALGRLYQMMDDCRDLMGTKDQRRAGRDLLEGKPCFYFISAPPSLQEAMKSFLSHDSPQVLKKIRQDYFRGSGGRKLEEEIGSQMDILRSYFQKDSILDPLEGILKTFQKDVQQLHESSTAQRSMQ